MEIEAIKGLFDEHFARIDKLVNERLEAFETAPAVKSAGYVSPDGGTADKSVKSFADFLTAIQRNDTRRLNGVYKSGWQVLEGEGDDGLKSLNGSSGPSGGYAVPVEYETEIQKLAAQMGFIEDLAFKVNMNSETKMIPMLKQDGTPTSSGEGASGYFGGMYFSMTPEANTIEERSPQFEMMEVRARKLAGLTVSSNELRQDAPQIERELQMLFAEGLAAAKQYLFLVGNGAGKPLGMLNAANPSRLLHDRKASGDAIEIEDVTGLISKMVPSLAGNAIFLAHPYAVDYLMRISLTTNGDPAFQPATNTPEGSPLLGTLVGRKVYASEYLAVPGSAGDLALVAPRAYAVATRSGITIAGSEHAYFATDQYAWRVTTRIDGQPRVKGTIKLADGSASEVSPFVVLN